jgi:hypothetical protein
MALGFGRRGPEAAPPPASAFAQEVLKRFSEKDIGGEKRRDALLSQLKSRMLVETGSGLLSLGMYAGVGSVLEGGRALTALLRGGVNTGAAGFHAASGAEFAKLRGMANEVSESTRSFVTANRDSLSAPDSQKKLEMLISAQVLLQQHGMVRRYEEKSTPPDPKSAARSKKLSNMMGGAVIDKVGHWLDRPNKRFGKGGHIEGIKRRAGEFLKTNEGKQAVQKGLLYSSVTLMSALNPAALAVGAGFSVLDRWNRVQALRNQAHEIKNAEANLGGSELAELLSLYEKHIGGDATAVDNLTAQIESTAPAAASILDDEIKSARKSAGKFAVGMTGVATLLGASFAHAHGAEHHSVTSGSGAPDNSHSTPMDQFAHPANPDHPVPGTGAPSPDSLHSGTTGPIPPHDGTPLPGGHELDGATPSGPSTHIEPTGPSSPQPPLGERAAGAPGGPSTSHEAFPPTGPNSSLTGGDTHYAGEAPRATGAGGAASSEGLKIEHEIPLPPGSKSEGWGTEDLNGDGTQERFQLVEQDGKHYALVNLFDRNHDGSLEGEHQLSDHYIKVEVGHGTDGSIDLNGKFGLAIDARTGEADPIDGQSVVHFERKIDTIVNHFKSLDSKTYNADWETKFRAEHTGHDYTDLSGRSGVMVDLGHGAEGDPDGIPDVQAFLKPGNHLEAHWHGTIYSEYLTGASHENTYEHNPEGANNPELKSALDNSALKFDSLKPTFDRFVVHGGNYSEAAKMMIDHRSELPASIRSSFDTYLADGKHTPAELQKNLADLMAAKHGSVSYAEINQAITASEVPAPAPKEETPVPQPAPGPETAPLSRTVELHGAQGQQLLEGNILQDKGTRDTYIESIKEMPDKNNIDIKYTRDAQERPIILIQPGDGEEGSSTEILLTSADKNRVEEFLRSSKE